MTGAVGRTFCLLQVDAFTTVPLEGNPCAVLLDAGELSDETMQAIALEMNLSETSFVVGSDVADFGVRYFTPAEEIPLAGHPTIATVHALTEWGRLEAGRDRVTLEMKAGVIPVDLEWDGPCLAYATMTQNRPAFGTIWDADAVLPAFGLERDDVLPGVPLQTVSTGTPQLMIPVRDLATLDRVAVDAVAYRRLRDGGDFFSPHLFCVGGFTGEGQTAARHFGVPPDTPEDPFTGSATGGMAAYLWKYGLIPSPLFTAEQGHNMGRPGRARVEVVGPRDDIESVRVGGPAVTVLRGELEIP